MFSFSFGSPTVNLFGVEIHVHFGRREEAIRPAGDRKIEPPIPAQLSPSVPVGRATWRAFDVQWKAEHGKVCSGYEAAKWEYGRKNGLLNSYGWHRPFSAENALILLYQISMALFAIDFPIRLLFFFSSIAAVALMSLSHRAFVREFGT